MEFTIKKENGINLLELSGNIMGGPESMKINLDIHSLIENGERKFIIDLTQVNLMNSSGLGTLIASLSSIKKVGGILKIASPNEKIKNLFIVTKLNTVFDLKNSVSDAIKDF